MVDILHILLPARNSRNIFMIKSKQDYKYYLEADRIALGKKRKKPMIFFDEVWVFERLLRKVEYYKNCKKSKFYHPYYYYLYLKLHLLSIFLGFHIKEWLKNNSKFSLWEWLYNSISPNKHQRIYRLSLIHISEPTRRTPISYAVFCLKKKKKIFKYIQKK